MNKVQIVGRLTRDPEVRYSQGDNPSTIARFSVAVNRKFKNSEGNYEADFINCVAFGKSGDFIEKYFKKGMAIGLTGRFQTGNYTNKDGIKVYTTDIVAEEVEFVESKGSGNNSDSATGRPATEISDGFMNIPDGIDEELPFEDSEYGR